MAKEAKGFNRLKLSTKMFMGTIIPLILIAICESFAPSFTCRRALISTFPAFAGKATLQEIQEKVSKAKGEEAFDQMRTILNRMDKDFARADNAHGDNLVLSIAKNMIDHENNLRGYLLTGQKKFLEGT